MNNTYYLAANSSGGYISFFDECIEGMGKIIVLKNASGYAKKMLFSELIKLLDLRGICYDKIIRCGTKDETDAVIINKLSTVIADENLFLKEIPLYADIIDFAEHIRLDVEIQRELTGIRNKQDTLKRRMFRHLDNAKKIHDEWEKIYISNMDYDKLNFESDKLISGIFDGLSASNSALSQKNSDRFFGTLLGRGNVNYIEELTKDVTRRIYIKGRPGTGKSTFLKKIIKIANEYNYITENYYCSFDPSSLDMVIIRDIGIAVFDSTQPHEIFPSRSTDEIFDIYDIAVKDNTDEIYNDELMRIASDYKCEIQKASECLYTCDAYLRMRDSLIYDEYLSGNCINRIIALSNLN